MGSEFIDRFVIILKYQIDIFIQERVMLRLTSLAKVVTSLCLVLPSLAFAHENPCNAKTLFDEAVLNNMSHTCSDGVLYIGLNDFVTFMGNPDSQNTVSVEVEGKKIDLKLVEKSGMFFVLTDDETIIDLETSNEFQQHEDGSTRPSPGSSSGGSQDSPKSIRDCVRGAASELISEGVKGRIRSLPEAGVAALSGCVKGAVVGQVIGGE